MPWYHCAPTMSMKPMPVFIGGWWMATRVGWSELSSSFSSHCRRRGPKNGSSLSSKWLFSIRVRKSGPSMAYW